MGEYFVIVNPAKRQYLDAFHFGESIEFSGILGGKHGAAVALLICDEAGTLPAPASTWVGDPVIATGDSAGPNTAGIATGTAADPQRNLYRMAREEFEDLSLPAIAMLCQHRPAWAAEFAASALRDPWVLAALGHVVFHLGCPPLQRALQTTLGSEWTRQYKRASERYPWTPGARPDDARDND